MEFELIVRLFCLWVDIVSSLLHRLHHRTLICQFNLCIHLMASFRIMLLNWWMWLYSGIVGVIVICSFSHLSLSY